MGVFVGFNTFAMQLLQPAMQLEVAEIASVLGRMSTPLTRPLQAWWTNR